MIILLTRVGLGLKKIATATKTQKARKRFAQKIKFYEIFAKIFLTQLYGSIMTFSLCTYVGGGGGKRTD